MEHKQNSLYLFKQTIQAFFFYSVTKFYHLVMWGLRKMHRHCFRTFTYWLKNLLWPTFLKTEGIYTIYLLKNINYLKKWFFFPFDWEREEELSVAVKMTIWQTTKLPCWQQFLLTTVDRNEHKDRRWIKETSLAVSDESENDSITWNGSRERIL